MVVIPAYAIYLTVRNQKSWNGFLPCRWQCLEHSHPSNDLRKLCLWQCSVGKCLHQMDFLCRVEAVEQFKHVSVKFADVGYFHIEPHTLTSKNLIGTNFYILQPIKTEKLLLSLWKNGTDSSHCNFLPHLCTVQDFCPLIVFQKMVGNSKANASL